MNDGLLIRMAGVGDAIAVPQRIGGTDVQVLRGVGHQLRQTRRPGQ